MTLSKSIAYMFIFLTSCQHYIFAMNSNIKQSQKSPQQTIQKLQQDLETAKEEKNMYANWNSLLQSSLHHEQVQKSEYAQTIKVLKQEILKLRQENLFLEKKAAIGHSVLEENKILLQENNNLRTELAHMHNAEEQVQCFQDYYCIVKNGTIYFYKYQ